MLVGQPELNEMLARPELRQLRQRIVLRHHLCPFGAEETGHYVEERLRLAGYTGKGIFRPSALREIHQQTGGVPRVINIICDGALLCGYSRDWSRLGPEAIREVAHDLELPVANLESRHEAAGVRPARRRGLLGLFR
jgi:general secretion pathway protein A